MQNKAIFKLKTALQFDQNPLVNSHELCNFDAPEPTGESTDKPADEPVTTESK